jgi:hypothetical protein
MANPNIQARMARLRAAPKHVKAAGGYAALLGLVSLLRACAYAYAGRIFLGKALLYAVPMLLVFWYSGFSLRDRSRWGFVVLAVLALLPLFGMFVASVHLLRLVVEGTVAANRGEAVVGIAGLCQLIVTGFFLRHFLASETRRYVWTAPPPAQPETPPEGQP